MSLPPRVLMPYRAMLYTLFAVGLSMVIVGMWLRAVRPILQRSDAAELRSPPIGIAWIAIEKAHDAGGPPGAIAHPNRALHKFINGVSLLNLLLVCSLLVVGFFATFREWVRIATLPSARRRRQRTHYVDAWKLAGERARPQALPEEPGDSAV